MLFKMLCLVQCYVSIRRGDLIKVGQTFDVNINNSKLRNYLSALLLSHVVRLAQFSIHFDKRTVRITRITASIWKLKNVIR